MAIPNEAASLRILVDTPEGMPVEQIETLIAGIRALTGIAALSVLPAELGEDEGFGTIWYTTLGGLFGYARRRRRPSDVEIRVTRLHYGSPLEVVAGIVGVGWVVVKAGAAIAQLLTTQLAERRRLVSEANKNNAEARKFDEEARLLRLQGDALAVENARRVEDLAAEARTRANETLQGIRTDVASLLLDREGPEAAEQFLRATDDAEALGQAASLAEFDVIVDVEPDRPAGANSIDTDY